MTRQTIVEVLDAGFATTIQDLGRPGYAHLGVPRAGAVDPRSAALANRLVGNPVDNAVLETTMLGLRLKVHRALTLAVTGATALVNIDGRARPWGEACTVAAGAEVSVGPALTGVRSYVAFGGGIVVEPVLGSRSTDTLAFVGPPKVIRGAKLPIGRPTSLPPESPPFVAAIEAREVVSLRLHEGPRRDWLTPVGLERLSAAAYVVTPASNRIGLRLSGDRLSRSALGRAELASEGIVLGSVQVPPDGSPVVFLNDHPVTGGYPVVGVIDQRDLPQCGQLRPGDQVRFVAI